MSVRLRYAVVTPARDDAADLARLAESVTAQTILPQTWVIVDNGSTDRTAGVAADVAAAHSWVRTLEIPGEAAPRRGAPIVRAFMAGVDSIGPLPEVVVKLDADVTTDPDYFERLLTVFASDGRLGIAGGICWELQDGSWRPQHTTRDHVRGAARAYRRECLEDVLPLVERVGWDGIDELRAQTHGWRVRSIDDLVVRHYRSLGVREPRLSKWIEQGDMAHFMGYRSSYLLARAAYRALRDPSALAMVYGYWRAVLRRSPRYEDPDVRRLLQVEQSWRRLPRRIREALGRIS